ncbi:hypothetical protein DM02DRAFT_675127 [Periconia macrospinosa]|uniref:26S proteasome complex subunit SEM1 n=1 Tax=Periconia macrospinosa TaxID=97972 RepID=A0A2V1DD10_9PLEO|nr:hypothetical protein DM02DRAFT_675127 [Periconia macrospinosa]
MSGATQAPTKSTDDKSKTVDAENSENKKAAVAPLEEDDEFEDFPVEDWTEEESQIPGGTTHLWEESWDDDDTSEDFAVQLREELKKLGNSK